MHDDGVLPGDVVVVHKQARARNGQTVIALVNGQVTIKTYYRQGHALRQGLSEYPDPSSYAHDGALGSHHQRSGWSQGN